MQAEDGGGSAKQERARKIDSKSKSISRKSFYSNVARKLYFEAAAEEEEEIEVPSTARIGLALESSLQLLAASEGTNNKGSKKRAAKALSMGLVGASPRSPSTLSRLQKVRALRWQDISTEDSHKHYPLIASQGSRGSIWSSRRVAIRHSPLWIWSRLLIFKEEIS